MKQIIKIYQIIDIGNCPYAFRSFKEDKFKDTDYEVVWYDVADDDSNSTTTLERLFAKFNHTLPQGYRGRSMSVSDVVSIGDSYFYCEPDGWTDITKIVKEILNGSR